jgi:integrase
MTISVVKTGPGFRARIRRKGVELSRTFPTQAEATAWALKNVGEIAGDSYIDRTREKTTTLAQLIKRYLEEVTPSKKGARTETARLKDWMRRPWAALPVLSISPHHITEWRNEQQAAGKAPSTISNHINTLSHVFKIARSEWGYRIDNPVQGIRRPKQRRARIAVPDDELEKALLEKADQSRARWLRPMIAIAAWSAMRQGEIRGLKWRDVDFEAHEIHVRDSKNGDERWVTMLPIVEAELKRWAGNKDLRELRDDWIFPSANDPTRTLPLYTATCGFRDLMRQVWEEAEEGKKPQKIHYHDLRHWACTRLADFHVDALDLALTTGHRTLQILMRYYNPKRKARTERILARASVLIGSEK